MQLSGSQPFRGLVGLVFRNSHLWLAFERYQRNSTRRVYPGIAIGISDRLRVGRDAAEGSYSSALDRFSLVPRFRILELEQLPSLLHCRICGHCVFELVFCRPSYGGHREMLTLERRLRRAPNGVWGDNQLPQRQPLEPHCPVEGYLLQSHLELN